MLRMVSKGRVIVVNVRNGPFYNTSGIFMSLWLFQILISMLKPLVKTKQILSDKRMQMNRQISMKHLLLEASCYGQGRHSDTRSVFLGIQSGLSLLGDSIQGAEPHVVCFCVWIYKTSKI
jgi:hypothetical protein